MGDRNFILSANAEFKIDGVDIGYTTEPTTIRIERDYNDAVVEQVKGTIKTFLTNETMTIETAFSELTMNNLKTVWDQEGSLLIGGTFLALGTEDGANEHTLTINAAAPTGDSLTYQVWYIFRACSMEAGQITLGRGEVTSVPASFKCLKDDSNGNRFGYRELTNTKG